MNDLSLTSPREELETALAQENSTDNVQQILDIFNINLLKQGAVRALRLSDIQDRLLDHLEDELVNHSEDLTLDEIRKTFKVVSEAKTAAPPLTVEQVPQIQINTQINVASELDSDARARVLAAVNNILESKGEDSDGD